MWLWVECFVPWCDCSFWAVFTLTTCMTTSAGWFSFWASPVYHLPKPTRQVSTWCNLPDGQEIYCGMFFSNAHVFISCRYVAPDLKKMDTLEATVPSMVKICNLRCTKKCASFWLINLIYTQILWKKLVPINSSVNLLLILLA